jgi:hypothetical protein
MDFWRRAPRISRLQKVRNEVIREKWSNTNSFGKNGKQCIEMVWTSSMPGG